MVLRDYRVLIGYLRSVDQFGKLTFSRKGNVVEHSSFLLISNVGNLLLQGTIERIHVGSEYGDIPRGIYLVRGENVALCGEIVSKNSEDRQFEYDICWFVQDAELEAKQPLKQVSIDVILEAQRQQQEERVKEKKKRENILRSRGINPLEHNEDTFS